jgi:hypothetical protein
MIVELNPMVKSVRGRLGNTVFYNWHGLQCARAYCIPRNPDTMEQRKTRGRFADAVHAWQLLDDVEKHLWRRRAARMRMSGYNLFISGHMKMNAGDCFNPAKTRNDSSHKCSLSYPSSVPSITRSVSDPYPRLYRSNPPPLVYQAHLH